jgi:glycosyltransferase involved in cell wall biosynthesis
VSAIAKRRATFSVVVPCFNYGHVLEGCLQSVLDQEGADVRVLLIDDLSTDGSAEVCSRLAALDDRVEFRRHRRNEGLIATANEGLDWAEGEYVLLLSADDLLVPGSLRRAAEVMTANPSVGMVYGRPLLAREGEPMPAPTGRWRATDVWPGADWIRLRCRSGHNCISSPEAVVRNSVQRAVGGYDPACYHASDLNMWLRIAAVADVAYVRGVPQAIYRIHAGSMLRSQNSPLVDLRERKLAFDSFFARSSSRLDRPERLRALVGRALARQALWQASRAFDRGLVAGPDALPVDELVDFALEAYPDARRLREWQGLRVRRLVGAGRSLFFFPFIATGAAHRLHYHASQLRWRLRGV